MSFPTSPVPNSISITSLNPTYTSVTHSLKRQVRTRGGQRWQIDATGTLAVNNSAGYVAGASTITVDGLTGTLKAGDFIKFANHDKVYTVVADGVTSLIIEPSLQLPVPNNVVITYNAVPFTVSFTSDTQNMSVGANGFVNYSVKLIEVV